MHYLQPGVGHYGVFNGSRFRSEIAPRISDFILQHPDAGKDGVAPAADEGRELDLRRPARDGSRKSRLIC